MAQIFKNNIAGVLAAGLAPASTSMTLLDASAFPTPAAGDFYLLTLIGINANGQESSWEIVKVTSKASNTLTVERAQEGTTAAAWPAATTVQLRLTAGSVVAPTGNAATATKLAVARTINGVSFDGSADITINAVDSTAREPTITAGTTAQYWRGDKTWRDFDADVRAATLTGLSTATNSPVVSTDTVLQAVGKLQTQVGSSAAGFRNKIINGKMDISQRNGGTVMALTTTPTYFNDRWACILSNTPTGSLVTGRTTIQGALGSVQLGDGFTHCLYFQRQAGSYAGFARAIQVLETAESRSLAGRTVTLSFWAAINTGWLGGNITAAVLTGTGTDQTAAQFLAGTATGQATAASTTVTPTTTLTKYSVQAVVPSGATQVAVLLQNTGWSGSGSSPDIIAITGVQLEVGSVATPFEHRPYELELALCQRYYSRISVTAPSAGSVPFPGHGQAWSTTSAYIYVYDKATKRTSPTVATSAANTFAILQGGALVQANSISIPNLADGVILLSVGVSPASLVPGQPALLFTAVNLTAFVEFSAEL